MALYRHKQNSVQARREVFALFVYFLHKTRVALKSQTATIFSILLIHKGLIFSAGVKSDDRFPKMGIASVNM